MSLLSRLRLRVLGVASLLLLLAACGGGGGGGSGPTPPPPLQSQTIAFATAGPVARQYGDAAFTNAASGGAGSGAITYVSSNAAVATVNATSGLVTIVSTGSAQITANKAADTTYAAASANYTLNVSPATQAIAFASAGPISKVFGDAPFTNASSGGAGTGAITYSSNNALVATVEASTGLVTIVGGGSADIRATKAADSNHLAAEASYTLNVAQAQQAIAFQNTGPLNRTFGDSSFTNAVTASPGTGAVTYASQDPAVATVSASGAVTIVGAGSTQITAAKAADNNYVAAQAAYTLNVAQAQQTIAFQNAGPLNRTFGDASFTNAVTASPGTGAVTFSSQTPAVATVAAGGAVTIVGAGSTQITAVKAADNNYLAAQASYTLNVAKAAQAINFNAPGPITKRLGDPVFTNPAVGGGGTGAVTYISDSPAVAQVNGSGAVTLIGVGTASITAMKATSANHLAAQASYTLTVRPLIQLEPLTGWIGATDTQLTLPPDAAGADFIRAPAANCTTLLPASCSGSTTTALGATTLTESTARLNTVAQYWLSRGALTGNPTAIGTSRFNAPTQQDPLVFNDQLWLVDGTYGGSTWSSTDGRAWVKRTTTPPFGDREGSQVVVHNNRFWLIAGALAGSFAVTNDVWSSTDGVNWTMATASAAFSRRTGHQVVVMSGRMWLIGGEDLGGNPINDVWSSTDGVNWTRATATPPFQARRRFEAVAFNGRLWVLGGSFNNQTNYLRDVWSSADGVSWRQETQLPGAARDGMQVVVFENRLYMMGGYDGSTIRSDVWHTDDGITWTEDTPSAAFGPRLQHGLVSFHDRIFLIGGWNSIRGLEDVWSSTDGVDWQYEDPAAPYEAISRQVLIEFSGRLWAVGRGSDERTHAASTVDGIDWTESPGAASIPQRYGPAVAVFNNRLWLMGGSRPQGVSNTEFMNDLWSTADGVSWTQSPEPPFVGRTRAQMFALNGRMFVLGGTGFNVPGSDVWSTDDGITWRQDLPLGPFGVRSQHEVAVFNGRAWMLGGFEQAPDAWSSADGLTWTQEALNDTDVAERHDLEMAVFNNRLWVIGGLRREVNGTFTPLNDVWSSADGNTWTRETGNANWSPRTEHAAAGFGGKLWLFGGEWQFTGGTNREVWQSADGISWRLRYRNLIETP